MDQKNRHAPFFSMQCTTLYSNGIPCIVVCCKICMSELHCLQYDDIQNEWALMHRTCPNMHYHSGGDCKSFFHPSNKICAESVLSNKLPIEVYNTVQCKDTRLNSPSYNYFFITTIVVLCLPNIQALCTSWLQAYGCIKM